LLTVFCAFDGCEESSVAAVVNPAKTITNKNLMSGIVISLNIKLFKHYFSDDEKYQQY
jgi:hypothetical protein